MKQFLELPAGSPAAAAFIMDGDEMEPYILRGSAVRLSFALPEPGECGLFAVDGQAMVRQYCEDSFGGVYLFCLNRARKDLDMALPAGCGKQVVCLGKVLLPKTPPLPLD